MICIYKIENKINKKVYIGQSINYEKRMLEHIWGRKNEKQHIQQVIDRAIKKYGKENFNFEKIIDCENQEEADELERYYIKKYNSLKPNGYNVLKGGRFQQGAWNSKKIKVYDLEANFLGEYESASEYERLFPKYNALQINASCRKKTRCKDKMFRFAEDEKPEKYVKPESCRKKKIYQYDIYGNFINEYESVSIASQKTKIPRPQISNCLIGHTLTAKNYQWKYFKKDKIEPLTSKMLNSKGFQIQKIDENGNIIKTYYTTIEAVLDMGLEKKKYKQLCDCIKNDKKFNGYKWKRIKKKSCQA